MRGVAIALVTLLLATNASGQFYDTRSMGLGGTPLRDGRGTLRHANPAYYAVPAPGDVRAGWALPLGLLQTLGSLPRFDPETSDFDATAVLQWQLQPPGPLVLGRQGPLSADVDAVFETDRLLLSGREDALPREDVRRAGTLSLGELVYTIDLGQKYPVVALGVNGFAQHAVDIDQHSPGSGQQDWRGWGALQAGFGLQAIVAREFRLGAAPRASSSDWQEDYWDREDARPRLWIGAAARRLVGVALTHLEGSATAGPLGLDYDAVYTSARAGFDGGAALGWGFDLGAVLRWGAWEAGLAAADLGARLDWPDVRRDRYFPNLADQALGHERIADGVRFATKLPTRVLLNVRLRRPNATWILDAGGVGNRREGHLGCERARGAWRWRGGLGLDTRTQLQVGAGVGWRTHPWRLDLGLLTDSGNLDGSRALTVGLSVGWAR